MDWPQILLVALWALNFGIVVSKNGKPSGNYSVFYTGLGLAIVSTILWWGGFWG